VGLTQDRCVKPYVHHQNSLFFLLDGVADLDPVCVAQEELLSKEIKLKMYTVGSIYRGGFRADRYYGQNLQTEFYKLIIIINQQ